MNSGIYVTTDLSHLWNEARVNKNVDIIKISIDDQNAFVISQQESSQGNAVAEAAKLLEPRQPAYLLIRDESSLDKF